MYSLHNHTGVSSASRGFTDSSIKLEDLIVRAKELGLKGVAITEHEAIGSHVQAKQLEEKYDFPVLLGNEIYLVSDEQDELLRSDYQTGMYYPHFLLLALDEVGHRQLRELSDIAWMSSYTQRGMVRTPTKMSDIGRIVGSNKGHVVSSTACLGGQLSKWIADIMTSEDINRVEMRERQVREFVKWGADTFGEGNFFLECQPPSYIEGEQRDLQAFVNDYMKSLSEEMDVPYIITTDGHYMSRDLLPIHSAFLNSKDGGNEREVEDFYATAYLMGREEVIELFKPFWNETEIQKGLDNTALIGNRAERYSFNRKQVIPKIELKPGWKISEDFFPKKYKYVQQMINSEYEQDRYLLHLIEKGMKEKLELEDYSETFDRLEQELAEFWYVSKIIEDRLSAYFVTVSKLVEIMWNEGDSLVGVGRGSSASSIISYLLDVTQINPLKMPVEMPFYRFIDRERAEMPDIDIDTQSNRRLQVFEAVKNYFEKLGGQVVNCCTYGTLGSKSAIQTACRGLDLPSEVGQSMSSLVPTERGFTWSLSDCYYGSKERDRKPIKEFVNLAEANKELWEVAQLVEGVIVNRGVHASGVFITNDSYVNYGARMKSPDGTVTSQWDLHDAEVYKNIKYDMLTTEALSKLRITMDSLIENGHIEKKENLRETYASVLNPHILDYDKPEVWDAVNNNEVMDLFQFDSVVALQTIAEVKPRSLIELAQTNSLMRLQPQHGAIETPTEMYIRYKNDISKWYEDMDKANVPKKDQEIIKDVLLPFNGVADTQETIMALSRDNRLSNFTVGEAHRLRSVIGKKQMNQIPIIRELFYEKGLGNGVCKNTLDYLWNHQVSLQTGYSFSILHVMSYSYVALQQLILYTQYPSIYWNTAVLTVNSGSVEDEAEGVNKASNYGKTAKAIGDLQQNGVTVALPLINQADYSFTSDEKNNRIVFALRGINGIGGDVARTIINLRPYTSLKDFVDKVTNISEDDTENVKIGNSKIITLIKAGCFDELEAKPREEVMMDYLNMIVEPKTSLNMQNMNAILEYEIIPKRLNDEVRIINFRNYILEKRNLVRSSNNFKSKKVYKVKGEDRYLTEIAKDFFSAHLEHLIEEGKNYWYNDEGVIEIYDTDFKRAVDKKIEKLKDWMTTKEAVDLFNKCLLQDQWDKYCQGSLSRWEMDSLSFYYHDHELLKSNMAEYGIEDFNTLPAEPKKVGSYKWAGREWDEYQIHRIAGTVLDRDKTKHTITLLTTTGVVTLKMYSGAFSHYDKQIARTYKHKGKDKREILESSWFTRGTLLSVVGFRRGDMFVPKKYRNSVYRHTIQKITEITESGDLMFQSERVKGD